MIFESQRAKISFGERTGERRTDFEKEEKYRHQQRVHRMPQGWSIRKLSRFNVILSGVYENRPEPTGHATYPQPLGAIMTEIADNHRYMKHFSTSRIL